MFPSRPTNVTTPLLSNTNRQSDSRRQCRLCSGTTPFFRRLSRASCSGSRRSELPLSSVTVGPRTVVVYASSLRCGYSGKWNMSETTGRLRPRHRQPGVPPEGAAHRSLQPGRGRSVGCAAAANSPEKSPFLRPFLRI